MVTLNGCAHLEILLYKPTGDFNIRPNFILLIQDRPDDIDASLEGNRLDEFNTYKASMFVKVFSITCKLL